MTTHTARAILELAADYADARRDPDEEAGETRMQDLADRLAAALSA